MRGLRRRLASCALAVLVCQSAIVFAAPLASCCTSPHGVAARATAEPDCCPAGAHAPGQCPRHARSTAATKVSCRMPRDAPHGAQVLLGAVGLAPAPALSIAAPVASLATSVAAIDPETRPFVPDSPPPRVR
jgi:hypothetical protein